MDLYKQYLKEREDKDILISEFGFAVYKIEKDSIYLQDVYIIPSMRKKGLTKEFSNKIENIGKELNKKAILTSFCLEAKNWKISKKVIKQCGFKYFTKDRWNKVIYCIKELK